MKSNYLSHKSSIGHSPTSEFNNSIPLVDGNKYFKFKRFFKKALQIGVKVGMGIAIIFCGKTVFAQESTIPAYSPDNVQDILWQWRDEANFVDGDMVSGDSLKLALFYITPEGDTLPFLDNSEQDTFFTLTTTSGETIHVGKVDTVMGEGIESPRAFITKFSGYKTGDTLKIKTIQEMWDNGFFVLIHADTNFYPLGATFPEFVYYRGEGDHTTFQVFQTREGVYSIPWSEIELSIEELEREVFTKDLTIQTYPNPTNAVANVLIKDADSDLRITTIDGRVSDIPIRIKNGIIALDLSEIPSGPVIVSYIDSEGVKHTGSISVVK